jgi:hypothetical protein
MRYLISNKFGRTAWTITKASTYMGQNTSATSGIRTMISGPKMGLLLPLRDVCITYVITTVTIHQVELHKVVENNTGTRNVLSLGLSLSSLPTSFVSPFITNARTSHSSAMTLRDKMYK